MRLCVCLMMTMSHVLARRTRYDVARLSVSAGGLLGVYKSCRERNGQLSSERADGREELRRIRSAVNTHGRAVDGPLSRRLGGISGNYVVLKT